MTANNTNVRLAQPKPLQKLKLKKRIGKTRQEDKPPDFALNSADRILVFYTKYLKRAKPLSVNFKEDKSRNTAI